VAERAVDDAGPHPEIALAPHQTALLGQHHLVE
jgi:hypothetical protein